MGIDFGKMLGDAVKGVSDFIVKAGDDIQAYQAKIREDQAENQRNADRERLKPLFPEDFERSESVMTKMIRVSEIDKPHSESAVCKGSVGFRTVLDDLTVITLFRNQIDDFGLSFYPELENGVYYVDPCDRDHYIALDNYFAFMKEQRVAELQRIAQSLGAKHFKITYKERTASISSNSVDAAVSVKSDGVNVDAKGGHSASQSSTTAISVEAELRFPGHAPIKPELRYLKKEINVLNLIEMRMDPLSPLQHQHFNIELRNSSGIKEKDAAKIDAMLNAMKISGNITVVAEVQNEARRILEYEIEF